MHLLLPHASALSEGCQASLTGLRLPRLQALLAELSAQPPDHGDEWSLNPPHERALARMLGLAGADGCLPLAAWQARQDGVDTLDLAWGQFTPMHWQIGRDHLTALPSALLQLGADDSRALFDAALPLFTSEGWLLHWAAPQRWYAAHQSLRNLPTASPDRVAGRNPDSWLPDHPQARTLRRLQNEVQMLWYQAPVNDLRQQRCLPPVNSLWLSGCGPAQNVDPAAAATLRLDRSLAEPLLAGDWPAWAAAWQALDAGPLASLLQALHAGQDVGLTLAGERHAITWQGRRGWLQRRVAGWRAPGVATVLAQL